MKEEDYEKQRVLPPDGTEYEQNPISSRWMLGKAIVVVAGLLTLLQIILLFTSPWTRMESENLFGDTIVRISLNPLLIWLPVWSGILAGIWWWNCRKEASRRDWVALLISLLIASVFVAIAVSRRPPSSYIIHRPGDRDLPQYIRNF